MPVITKDTGIIEAVQKYPQIVQIFQAYGLGCIGCMAAHFETIGEGAGAHGIDVDALIADLNECIADSNNTGLVGMPFGRLHFSKSPVDEFELDTSVFVDVVQVGEDFFDIGFEVLYFLFQAVKAVGGRSGYQLADGYEGTHDGDVDFDGGVAVQHSGEHGKPLFGESIGEFTGSSPT